MENTQENLNKDSKIQLDQQVWIKIFTYLSPIKKEFFKLFFFMGLLSLADVLFPVVSRYTIDSIIVPRNLGNLWIVGLSYVGLSVFLAIIVYIFINQAAYLDAHIGYLFRKDLFNKLQTLSMSYFDKNAVGWTLSKVGSDTTRVASTVAWGLVDMMWASFYILFISIVMLITDFKLALLVMITMPVLGVIAALFSKKILSVQKVVRGINSTITGLYNDGISGARTSKSLVREELNIKEFEVETSKMRRFSIHSSFLNSSFVPFSLLIASIGTATIIFLGGNWVLGDVMSFGTFLMFFNYSKMFFEPFYELTRVYSDFVRAQAAGERVLGLLEETEFIKDSDAVIQKYGDHYSAKRENWEELHGEIEFREVTFGYIEGQNILENFNLTIKQGQSVALVGRTGAGKSTIVNLACRFYEPTGGQILIDGVDYRERSQLWLHSNLGYVLQTPHLFSGTIADNIRYGKLDATMEEIIEAAKKVDAHGFISAMEKGYDTQVGEGGALLSTGQKQLISFARAIIASPRLIVLDEATSSVDTETERIVQEAIKKVLSNRTSFIIAHRLSTIRDADIILVIDDGKVIEKGNHKSLMAEKGHYYELYTNQFRREAVENTLSAEIS